MLGDVADIKFKLPLLREDQSNPTDNNNNNNNNRSSSTLFSMDKFRESFAKAAGAVGLETKASQDSSTSIATEDSGTAMEEISEFCPKLSFKQVRYAKHLQSSYIPFLLISFTNPPILSLSFFSYIIIYYTSCTEINRICHLLPSRVYDHILILPLLCPFSGRTSNAICRILHLWKYSIPALIHVFMWTQQTIQVRHSKIFFFFFLKTFIHFNS